MEKVKRTKNPSLKVIESMSQELGKKFKGKSVCVSITSWVFRHTLNGIPRSDFRIYVEDTKSWENHSWFDLLDCYEEIMEGAYD